MKLTSLVFNLMFGALVSGFVSPAAVAYERRIDEVKRLYESAEYVKCLDRLFPLIEGAYADDSSAHYYYALLLEKSNQLEQAKQELSVALDINHHNRLAELKLAQIHVNEDDQLVKRKFGGTGLQISDGLVLRVAPNSLAQKAGIIPADKIVVIERSAQGKHLPYIVHGLVGTRVPFIIERKGKRYSCNLIYEEFNYNHRGEEEYVDPSSTPPVHSQRLNEEFRLLNEHRFALIKTGTDSIPISVLKRTSRSDSTVQQVKEGLGSIPSIVRITLKEKGWKIIITPTISDQFPDERAKQVYNNGGTIDNAGAMCFCSQKTVYIGESVSLGNGPPTPNRKIIYAVLHEFGHAFDCLTDLSVSPKFKSQFQEESARLTNGQVKEFDYFVQPAGIGARELVAELFAYKCSASATEEENLVVPFAHCYNTILAKILSL